MKITLPTKGPAKVCMPPMRLTRIGSAEWLQWAEKGSVLFSRRAPRAPASPGKGPGNNERGQTVVLYRQAGKFHPSVVFPQT